MQTPPATIAVASRENFVTDPFFLAARQILEKCLVELTQKNQELQYTRPITPADSLSATRCCCCSLQSIIERLGNWAPAALIPCLYCYPDQMQITQGQVNTIQDQSQLLPTGQLSLSTNYFQLVLDMHGFLPDEIRVSVKDDDVEVSATHQAMTFRQNVTKRYKLPRPVNTDMVQCTLSKDGILLVTAPWFP